MSNRVPTNRADAKGNLAVLKAECTATMRGEISSADIFMFAWDDCTVSVLEYAP